MTKSVQANGAARLPVAGLLVLAALAFGCGSGGGDHASDGGTCPTGQTLCAGVCTNTRLDPQHCGTCASACATGELCSSGTCVATCPAGLTSCGGGCTNTTYDPQHCGNCTTACAAGEVCWSGACVVSCPAGFTDCDGACTDTLRDPQHCGSCTYPCNSGESCVVGACMLICPPGQTNCSGTCTNTAIDPRHCGSCPNACDDGEICVAGACASFCAAGTTWCDGACADLTRDQDHCGACGTACTGTLTCSASRCSAPRGGGMVDSWGELWDSFQRPAATWADAGGACAAAGGRLPFATELYRVNATSGTGELSDTSATAPLWTQIPWDSTTPAAAAVRLSDGTISAPAVTALVAYRCVWPDATDAFFGANACHGPPGATCALAAGRPGHNFDAWERPAVTYLAASVECGLLHARVPLPIEFVEAITGSPALANGKNNYLWTSDQGRNDTVQVVRWTDSEPLTYTDIAPYVTWGAKGTAYRFRCTGAGLDTGTHPATITDEFVALSTRVKGESSDRTASTLHEAATTCFDAGGHLPLARELVELVEAGLPAGSGQPVWTADASSYQNQEYLLWTGTKSTFAGVYSAEANWSSRGATTRASRCVYLPVDAAYAAPAACNGGCFNVTKGPITMWSDTFDRVPATYLDAVKACVAAGGHLAGSRDLLELVRASLPNGSNAYLWTSDAAGGEVGAPPPPGDPAYNLMLRWSGTNPAFDGTAGGVPAYAQHGVRNATPVAPTAPYRCVWSNEYR
ncbi:MAG: hypothetical protein HY906_00085 [Deltaproteobacteria bacterium]|nr:hypothetical protein [Deltaproteobacteria bacterium]